MCRRRLTKTIETFNFIEYKIIVYLLSIDIYFDNDIYSGNQSFTIT